VTQAIVTQQYSGVYCRACGEPISLPARAEKAVTAQQAGASEAAAESQPLVFNLRCKACEKENFYGAKDVANIHGAPRLARPRARAAASLLRPDIKLARTANA
jgi:cytochrome c5